MSEVTKNISKYESYKYGFERISLSIENGFFLEAIAIAESIISDRLLSYLVYKLQLSGNCSKLPNTRTSFKDLIKTWKNLDGTVAWKQREDLAADTDKWRNLRNECTHALAKSNPGNPTKPVQEFVSLASESALEGKLLANYICGWTSKQKRIIRKGLEIVEL
jgi:hypothetical protein